MIKKVLIVVGTRPNFIKVNQFKKSAAAYPGLDIKLVHTGQHYDEKMADVFFRQFNLTPDFYLNISGNSANTQMAEIMIGLEKTISEYKPDLLMVVGDVNSTFAAALTGNKLGIKIAHLESGLRSFDRSMPEEINRILTDEISDYFFVTEESGLRHLKEKGHSSNVFFVGNTMIDTMVAFDKQIRESDIMQKLDLKTNGFILMTIHRPATVDNVKELEKLFNLLEHISTNYQIVFPIHPRTINNLKKFELYDKWNDLKALKITEPLDYFSFHKLISECKFVLTDSGGIQEESTYRLKPCLTLRPNTERPVTVTVGTNELLPFSLDLIKEKIKLIEEGIFKKGAIPELWDGRSTERIVKILSEIL